MEEVKTDPEIRIRENLDLTLVRYNFLNSAIKALLD